MIIIPIAIITHDMGVSRSVLFSLETSTLFLNAASPLFAAKPIELRNLMSAQRPPTTIAPTPRYRICEVQIPQPVSIASCPAPTEMSLAMICQGIAIHQLMTPPANTKNEMRSPTIYPTPINAGDKLTPI